MQIETVEDLSNWIADKLGVYGACKSEDPDGCEAEENDFCCRVGFVMIMNERIEAAVENTKRLDAAFNQPTTNITDRKC